MTQPVERSNDANTVRQTPPDPPPPPPPPAPQPVAPVDGSGVTRIAQLRQDGRTRRDQLDAAYAGLSAGAVTAQQPFIADARAQAAYQQAYGEALQQFRAFHRDHIQPLAEKLANAAGQPGAADRFYAEAVNQLKAQPQFQDMPMSMIDVANRAGNAYRTALGDFGFTTGDVPRPNPLRAADFLQNYAGDGTGTLTRLGPERLQARIDNNVPPGDYMVRLLGEPYTHTPDAVLSRSPRAWASPLDEAAGFRLNSSELFGAFGLTSSTSPGEQRMAVLNLADYTAVPATWETMLSTAQSDASRPASPFRAFAGRDENFWGRVQSYDYGSALDQIKGGGTTPEAFAALLDARGNGEGDVFRARHALDEQMGVNRYFRGDGLVTYPQPDGTPAAREFGVGERPLRLGQRTANGAYPEIAFLDLNATGSGAATAPTATPVRETPFVPEAPNTLRAERRNGALAGAATGFLFSGGNAINDVLNGRRGVGDALLDVTAQTAMGGGTGAGAAVLENYSTRAINTFMGGASRTAAGQLTRQALGSGIAGGVINSGFALYDNYDAYQRGDISGTQYAGQVAGEAAVGLAAGAAGAYAGAVIGSFIPIPVVGTLAGAAVGFAVGMGVDYLSRELGLNQAVANLTEGAVELGAQAYGAVSQAASDLVGDAGEVASNVISDVGDGVSNLAQGARTAVEDLAGGAVNRLASIFG